MLLTELLERQKDNEKMAIRYGDNEIKFSDWYSCSHSLSCVLNEVFEKNSYNVAIFLPNSINYAIAYFSILFANGVIVPIGVQSKRIEIISTLEYCEIDVIITSLEYRDLLNDYLCDYKYEVSLIFIEDYSIESINTGKRFSYKSFADKNAGTEDDVAIMLHTSGTTSNPKRVMLTHSNIINNIESNIKSLNLTEKDKVLISMPMYFGYCNTAQFLTHLYLGASIVIMHGKFFPKLFFEIIQTENITTFTGVPSMLLMLLEYRYSSNYDIKSLRYICFGGGKMPVESLKKLINAFDSIGFVQTYGQTEASPRITALLPVDSLRKIGSVGLPIPNVKIKIVDEAGGCLSSNEIGEIVVQGKNVMKGYYKQEIATKNAVKNGWLYTGDLGYLDDEGYLYLTGRKKNIIISGGINIYPEEVEEILLQHPNIADVCVIAFEHKLLGEVPAARVVLKNKNGIMDFKSFCKNKLTDYKIPVSFEIVDKLDKTYNGKIKRY